MSSLEEMGLVGNPYKRRNPQLEDLGEVTRFEVIDHTEDGEGRAFIKWLETKYRVQYSIQDEGKTIKVFLGEARDE